NCRGNEKQESTDHHHQLLQWPSACHREPAASCNRAEAADTSQQQGIEAAAPHNNKGAVPAHTLKKMQTLTHHTHLT
ncbi:hypothetical protein Hamer_G031727, partial [Homarus americanus]